jgi:AcrR family transcriptional regulator
MPSAKTARRSIEVPQRGAGRHTPGIRERKKAQTRSDIVKAAVRLIRKQGYEQTRVEDIVQSLGISQPTFFRYFPSKDGVLREIGQRGFSCMSGQLETELASESTTVERLRRLYDSYARDVEGDRALWQAVVLAGAMDPVRSPELRPAEEYTVGLLREVLLEGQRRGEITKDFPVVHLAEFMEGLYTTVVRQWAVDLTGPHKLTERSRSAVDFFMRAVRP